MTAWQAEVLGVDSVITVEGFSYLHDLFCTRDGLISLHQHKTLLCCHSLWLLRVCSDDAAHQCTQHKLTSTNLSLVEKMTLVTLLLCVYARANALYGTEEALYSSRNGIMRMRGWELKPENSNMKWDTHVQLWGWYALAKHNLLSLVQRELSEM